MNTRKIFLTCSAISWVLITAVIGLLSDKYTTNFLFAEQPQPQIVLPCEIVSVHDGDTLTATVTLKMNVRLLDCWAPELRESRGPAAKAKLVELASGKTGVLTIPLGHDIGSSFTFGRVLGRLSIDGRDVSDQMVASGLATKKKKG